MSNDSASIQLVCTSVKRESASVQTFTFATQTGAGFPHYYAGQFITLELEIGGTLVRRCYTLSSSPRGLAPQDEVAITVKAKDGGKVSNWLHQNILPGIKVKALQPAGKFHVKDAAPEKYAFFAGGVGITPVLSMLRWLISEHSKLDVVFVQCASQANDFLFVEELEGYKKIPGFQLHMQPSNDHHWSGVVGRLTSEVIQEVIPDLSQRNVLCCGPDGFMSHVQSLAVGLGVPENRYHEESFEIDTHHYGDVDASAGLEQYTITLSSDGQKLECRGDQTVLEAAKDAGVYIPYSCEAGICGSCKVRVLKGQVSGQNDGGLEDDEATDGWTLACCYRPVTDLEIDL